MIAKVAAATALVAAIFVSLATAPRDASAEDIPRKPPNMECVKKCQTLMKGYENTCISSCKDSCGKHDATCGRCMERCLTPHNAEVVACGRRCA